MPSRFLAEICAQAEVNEWFSRLVEADVSAHAGMIALAHSLPPGWLFIVELDGPRCIASQGTPITLQWQYGIPDYKSLDRTAEAHDVVVHQGRRVRWYRFVGDELLPKADNDPRTSKALLRAATERAGGRNARGQDLVQVVNALINAAANAVDSADPATLHATMIFKIKMRPDLQALLDDDDFRAFVARKAREIGAGRSIEVSG